jgi:tetratricopeptide (TPR) repeat protein
LSESEKTEFVGRENDINNLRAHWDAASEGNSRCLHVTATLGGGKHVLVSSMCKYAYEKTPNSIIVRTNLPVESTSQSIMLALYSSLYSAVLSKPELKGKVEMSLTMQASSAGERTKRWLDGFVGNIKSIAPNPESDQHKVNIPNDNPLLGYIEIITALSKEFPVVLDLRGVHHVYSLPFFTTLNALFSHTQQDDSSLKLLIVLQSEGVEGNEAWVAPPFQLFLERYSDNLHNIVVDPWGVNETKAYLESKSFEVGNAEQLTTINSGRPVMIAEMAKWIHEDEDFAKRFPELTLENIANITPNPEELEEDSESEEAGDEPEASDEEKAPKPRKAGADDAGDVAYLAALMGVSFPSGFIARMGNYTSDSIDDLLDATEIYDELQMSEPLKTWIYRFTKSIYRDSILSTRTSEDDQKVAKNVARFYEQFFAGMGPGFMAKTIRLHADNGDNNRAEMLINRALLAEEPQWWQATYEIIKNKSFVDWEKRLIRTTYLRLGEIASTGARPEDAERLIQEALGWIDSQLKTFDGKEGEEIEQQVKVYTATRGLMLQFGSQLDERRQDKYRARNRAQSALDIFRGLEDKAQIGEVLCRLARIEFVDGQIDTALTRIEEAEEAVGDLAAVRSHTFFLRGLLLQRQQKLEDAEKAFAQSNQLAGHPQVQRASMALDAGLKLGEVLAQQKKYAPAADVLTKVVKIAQNVRNGLAEHNACRMLTQVRDVLGQHESALGTANRAIQLAQGMRRGDLLPVDVNTAGVLNLKIGRSTEGVALFQQALKLMQDTQNSNLDLRRELMFNLGEGQRKIGENKAAKGNLEGAISIAGKQITQLQQQNRKIPAQFVQRLINIRQAAAGASRDSGDKGAAKGHLEEAIKMADAIKDNETRKKLKGELRDLRG